MTTTVLVLPVFKELPLALHLVVGFGGAPAFCVGEAHFLRDLQDMKMTGTK